MPKVAKMENQLAAFCAKPTTPYPETLRMRVTYGMAMSETSAFDAVRSTFMTVLCFTDLMSYSLSCRGWICFPCTFFTLLKRR